MTSPGHIELTRWRSKWATKSEDTWRHSVWFRPPAVGETGARWARGKLVIWPSLERRHNGPIASQITSLTIDYSIVYSDADQRKHQSSASLAFVRVIHRGPVNSPHKWPVTRKMFPFDDVIMVSRHPGIWWLCLKAMICPIPPPCSVVKIKMVATFVNT